MTNDLTSKAMTMVAALFAAASEARMSNSLLALHAQMLEDAADLIMELTARGTLGVTNDNS